MHVYGCVLNPRRLFQVYLHVDISYWPAVQLYESMGYEVVSMLEVKWEVRRAHVGACG